MVIAAAAIASWRGAVRRARRHPTAASRPGHVRTAHLRSAHLRPPSSASASPTASASAPPPPRASQQAAALGTVLTSSAAARTMLHNAVGQVEACSDLSGAISQLQGVVNQRSSEYGRASARASALPRVRR